MKKMLLAITAAMLLSLPAACMHHGHRGGPGGPGGSGCPKHQGCDCKCRQQPDCPQNRQQELPPPAK